MEVEHSARAEADAESVMVRHKYVAVIKDDMAYGITYSDAGSQFETHQAEYQSLLDSIRL